MFTIIFCDFCILCFSFNIWKFTFQSFILQQILQLNIFSVSHRCLRFSYKDNMFCWEKLQFKSNISTDCCTPQWTYFHCGDKMRRLGNIRFKHLFCLEVNILSLQSIWYILYFMTWKTLEDIACYRTKGLNWSLSFSTLLEDSKCFILTSFTNKHTLSYMRFFLCLSAF